MTDNNERLEKLQNSETQPLEPNDSTQAVTSMSNNNAHLQGLQSGRDRLDKHPGMSKKPESNTQGTPTRTTPTPLDRATLTHAKKDWSKWWIWGGIGAASVVGIFITVLVGNSLLTPDSVDNEAKQGIEMAPAPDIESEIPANLGPPSDIPTLAADITSSTVLIECPDGFGSGFVMDAEPLTGLPNSQIIVTNQHVIEGCEGQNELVVSTATGMSKGSVIAYDVSQDLAIIEAPALTAKPLTIGPVPVIGQWAMAVGNPDGITDTVTFGSITNVKLDEGFILSDVLIGPGNSGGPLVDNQGRVLGVNTAVLIVAEGFSFSVPIENLCDKLLECR